MNGARSDAARAGAEVARERLAALQRLAELLTAQEAALERGDLETFESLSRTAQALQAEIGMASSPEGGKAEAGGGHGPFLEQETSLLRASLACNERIQARLRDLRQEVGSEIKDNVASRPKGLVYLRAVAPEGRPSLDLRL